MFDKLQFVGYVNEDFETVKSTGSDKLKFVGQSDE